MARRTPKLRSLAIRLDRVSDAPLHWQLCEALRLAIARGELNAGERLPSTRDLALSLGISRNTVLVAYDELIAQEFIEARQGSGTRVAVQARNTPHAKLERETSADLSWTAVLRDAQFPQRRAAFSDADGNALYLFEPLVVPRS
jgi:DNA-binding transcriptional regulator YhcF (GntR family)